MKSKIEESRTVKDTNLAESMPIIESSNESLKSEFDLWLQEYKIIHNQILRRIEADEKGYELLIITISAIVAASSLVINYKAYFLLLILSLPFHILIWDQIKRAITSYRLAEYATKVVAPKLNRIIQGKNSQKSDYTEKFIGWENYDPIQNRAKQIVRLVRLLPKTGRTALQFGTSLILVILYFLFKDSDPQYFPTIADSLLIVVNVFVSTLSILAISTRLFRLAEN